MQRNITKLGYWEFDLALQIAYEGLWRACINFKPSKGFKISTLAWRIMTNRFIEEQKEKDRQVPISFSLDEFSVVDGLDSGDLPLALLDILEDSKSGRDALVELDELETLKQDIVYILEDIADEINIPHRVAKAAYLCLNEELTYKTSESRQQLSQLSKMVGPGVVRKVKKRLQQKLEDLGYNQ